MAFITIYNPPRLPTTTLQNAGPVALYSTRDSLTRILSPPLSDKERAKMLRSLVREHYAASSAVYLAPVAPGPKASVPRTARKVPLVGKAPVTTLAPKAGNRRRGQEGDGRRRRGKERDKRDREETRGRGKGQEGQGRDKRERIWRGRSSAFR
jgi:hypothetical protein